MSKLCKYCGAEMDDEAFECPECLKKIPGAEVLAKQKKIEKKQKRKSILLISSVAAGVVVWVVVASPSVFTVGISFLIGFPFSSRRISSVKAVSLTTICE